MDTLVHIETTLTLEQAAQLECILHCIGVMGLPARDVEALQTLELAITTAIEQNGF